MKTFKLEFNEQQLSVLNALLVDAPYRVAAPIIESVNRQIHQDVQPTEQNDADRSIPSGATPKNFKRFE